MNQFKARMDKAISEGHTNHNASMVRVIGKYISLHLMLFLIFFVVI